jgi:hypothetical protein
MYLAGNRYELAASRISVLRGGGEAPDACLKI